MSARRSATIAAVAVVAVIFAVGSCAGGEPERWEQRGFDSESECWLNHGWDGSISDGAENKRLFDFWCGPIEDD